MRFFKYLQVFVAILLAHQSLAQFPTQLTASEVYHKLDKASQFGSILYIAAHPDDENTRLISYFENKLLARTAYLSLTRGDGGQNLIGTEIGTGIGVLRTQELLAARRIDGGEQFFTRAIDFGYSKSAAESFEKWGQDNILADVVWVIRKFRPDAIVTRFPPNNYAGHGHHEASAAIAEIAFDAAADPNMFPEQLTFVEPWKPKRLYFNASSWWNKDIAERAKNSSDFVTVNVGAYNSLLGESYAQIASRSRSEHKSQGFGSDYAFGLNIEYLEYVMGEKANPETGILDGVDHSWESLGAPEIENLLETAKTEFDIKAPEKVASMVVEALKILANLDKTPTIAYKIEELEILLAELLCLRAEATTNTGKFARGDKVSVMLTAIAQGSIPVELRMAEIDATSSVDGQPLSPGELYAEELIYTIGADAPPTNPYWLNKPYEAIYTVDDYGVLGTPENKAAITVKAYVTALGYDFSLDVPVKHKLVDPVKAVVYAPVFIVPEATFNFSENVIITAGSDKTIDVELNVQNHVDELSGNLWLNLPKGWTSVPNTHQFSSSNRGESQKIQFSISPEPIAESGKVSVAFESNQFTAETTQSLQIISYPHIPEQIILSEAASELKFIDLKTGNVKNVGYIDGPGDDVAQYLKAAGYEVSHLNPQDLQSQDLMQYDAIISGIRVYNTLPEMAFANTALSKYIENGGTFIVQYNTSRGLKSEEIGPLKFELSRERVTDEEAIVHFIDPSHPSLNYPNLIAKEDFSNWVQERGLYFAGEWDKAFQPILSWSDPGEPAREGGLIVAQYGKGFMVYTGISFFRQLPAGVPGAYRLLANLMALSETGDEIHD